MSETAPSTKQQSCGMSFKPALVGVISLVLWIAAEIGNAWAKSQSNDVQVVKQVSMAIRVIFPCNVVFSMLSVWFLKRASRQNASEDSVVTPATTTNNRDIWWIFVPSLSLFLMLFFRLVVGVDHFETYPPNLDFGPKYGVVDSDTGLPVETNVAFDPELNTVTHCLQGILASLLAYVSAILLHRQQWRWHLLTSLAASALTIYPVYNFIKRITLKDPETFATSSFSNNAMEWAMGFVGGMGLGQCLEAFFTMKSSEPETSKKSNLLSENSGGADYGAAESQQSNQGTVYRVVTVLKAMFGILLILTVFGAAILYGFSWNNCQEIQDANTECILDPSKGPSIAVMVCFAAIPVLLNGIACCWLRRRT